MRRLIPWVFALWLLVPSQAASQTTIATMVDGIFATCGQNETCLDSKVDDPPKHRLGIVRVDDTWGRGLGAFSFDRVFPNGSRDEMVLIQGKESEDRHNGNKDGGGEFWMGLKKPGSGGNDDAMATVLEATYRNGFRFHLPIYAPNLMSGGAVSSYLQAGNYQLHLQASDGNFVLYQTVEGAQCPRWALNWLGSYYRGGYGWVDPSVLSAPCNR